MTQSKSVEELTNVFGQAAKIVECVPESLRSAAFERAIDELLGDGRSAQSPRLQLEHNVPATPTPRDRKRRKGSHADVNDSPTKPSSGRGHPSSPRTNSNRPGPKRMLEDLIGQGFFDQPRKIGDILEHIQQKRGYRYKPTDLSPALARLLREERLDRERDDEGQYQYTKRS